MSIDKIIQLSSKSIGQILNVKLLAGDASSRRYFRVFCADSNSYIACSDKTINENFIYIQKVYSEEGILVPNIIDIIKDEGFILQSDLGEITFLEYLSQNPGKEFELLNYKKAIDELIKIHKIDLTPLKGDCVELSFNQDKLLQEIDLTNSNFLEGYLDKSLTKEDNILLDESWAKICDSLNMNKFCLVHRDYHSKNIMITQNESINIIDFQDSRLGLPQYDLVSLLDDCYYSVDSDNVEVLKKYYWDNFLKATNTQESYEEFLNLYDYMALQRIYKAIGSFSYIYNTKNDPSYLRHIGFAFEKLRHILLKYEELEELLLFLSKRYYGN